MPTIDFFIKIVLLACLFFIVTITCTSVGGCSCDSPVLKLKITGVNGDKNGQS